MVSQHHLLNGHESEEILGDSGGQRSLVCCSPWGCKEPNLTTQEYACLHLVMAFVVHLICID